MNGTLITQSKKYYVLSGESLVNAESNLVVLGNARTCISRSYYAVFYGMLSLLYLDSEFVYNGYNNVLLQFNEFLNCHNITCITLKQISKLETMRDEADLAKECILFSSDDAEECLNEAKNICAAIKKKLFEAYKM